jgi:hypothetical protein
MFSTKMPRIWRVSLSLCIFGFAAHSQNGGTNWIGAPLAGLTANAGKTEVRPIQGVPGASTVGDPIALPAGVNRVHLAPLQQWALVEQGREGTLGRMPLNRTVPGSVAPIFGAMSAPALMSFSSNGRNAALVSRTGGVLQILTHLADTPQITLQSDISQLGVIAAAVSDDGTLPAVLTRTGEVYLILPGGSPSLIGRAGSPAGIGFLPSQAALAIIDGASATVTVVDGLNAQPLTRMVIPGPNLSGDAIFVQASSDGISLVFSVDGGQTAYLANLGDQSVHSLDVPAGFSMLERLNGDIFLFAANPNEAAWLLFADGGNLRAGFAQFAGKSVQREAPPPGGVGQAR